MEQQMKERLVGAAVLVTLGVVMIPLLLDGPEPAATARVGLELPAAEPVGRRQTIEIKRDADAPAGQSRTLGESGSPGSSPAPKPTPLPAKTSEPAKTPVSNTGKAAATPRESSPPPRPAEVPPVSTTGAPDNDPKPTKEQRGC